MCEISDYYCGRYLVEASFVRKSTNPLSLIEQLIRGAFIYLEEITGLSKALSNIHCGESWMATISAVDQLISYKQQFAGTTFLSVSRQ